MHCLADLPRVWYSPSWGLSAMPGSAEANEAYAALLIPMKYSIPEIH